MQRLGRRAGGGCKGSQPARRRRYPRGPLQACCASPVGSSFVRPAPPHSLAAVLWALQDVMSVVLFSVLPQLVDVLVACLYMALKLQPWTAVVVAITGKP